MKLPQFKFTYVLNQKGNEPNELQGYQSYSVAKLDMYYHNLKLNLTSAESHGKSNQQFNLRFSNYFFLLAA